MFSNRLKGASIAEMIIVIAVLSIISTIVVSFIVMSNENIRASNQKVDALNDIAVVESIVESWVKDMNAHGGELKVDDNNSSKIILDVTPSLWLSFENKEIIRQGDVIYTTSVVENISFEVLSNTNDEQLVLCTIEYKVQISNSKEQKYYYSFTVYNYEYLEEDDNLLQGGNTNEENN